MTRWASFKRGLDALAVYGLVSIVILGAVIQAIEAIRKGL